MTLQINPLSAAQSALIYLKNSGGLWDACGHGFEKWGALIRDTQGSSVRKKKAVIACVRLPFIDLWRLFTGRATLSDLGFRGAPAAAEAIAPEPAG